MDTAAKTSEDTAKMSLHIKGTPTASQETNCIPNNQNTAKTSIPSTSAQLKRRSFRRFRVCLVKCVTGVFIVVVFLRLASGRRR